MKWSEMRELICAFLETHPVSQTELARAASVTINTINQETRNENAIENGCKNKGGDEEVGEVREILFRGKRVDNGEWVYGYFWSNDVGNSFIRVTKENDEIVLKDYEVVPKTVGQCTGLVDKNGIEIFVGDILQYRCDIGRVTDNAWGTDTVYGYAIDNPNLDLSDHSNMEVIGNIHDNPELLKEDK